VKVIGVGFGRTGTMSLKAALEQLGAGPCFHMIDLIVGEGKERDLPHWMKTAAGEQVDWSEAFDGWEATVDWPGAARWREICDAFPEAPVLLNVREFEGWYASVENTILAAKLAAQSGGLEPDANRPPPDPRLWGVIDALIWEGDFQGRFQDKAWVRKMYDDRIAEIQTTISPDRLTIWNLGEDGWEPLAAMLGVPAPAEPFPRLHDTNEFRSEFGLPAIA
jgi:hypothetical protein